MNLGVTSEPPLRRSPGTHCVSSWEVGGQLTLKSPLHHGTSQILPVLLLLIDAWLKFCCFACLRLAPLVSAAACAIVFSEEEGRSTASALFS